MTVIPSDGTWNNELLISNDAEASSGNKSSVRAKHS